MKRVIVDYSNEIGPLGLADYLFFSSRFLQRPNPNLPAGIFAEMGISYTDATRRIREISLRFFADRIEVACLDWPSRLPVDDNRLVATFFSRVLEELVAL